MILIYEFENTLHNENIEKINEINSNLQYMIENEWFYEGTVNVMDTENKEVLKGENLKKIYIDIPFVKIESHGNEIILETQGISKIEINGKNEEVVITQTY